MKKINLFLTTLFVTAIMSLSLTACGTVNPMPDIPTECAHEYITQTIKATCLTQGYTEYKCSKCNKSYNDSYTEALGHTFVKGERNYSCSRCSQSECEGFTFHLATYGDESCYVVTGANKSTLINGVLEVPRRYESLPVRGILSRSFSSVAQNIKTLVVHDNIKDIYNFLFNDISIGGSDLTSKSTLETVIFDDTCKEMWIQSNAFYNCVNLANINVKKGMISYIPAEAVIAIGGAGSGEYLFKGTPYFKNKATVKNGLHYIADLLLYADMNEINSDVTIDNETVAINAATFTNGTFITSITIPKTVKFIGKEAFYGCSNLDTITYDGTIKEFQSIAIGPSAFNGLKASKVICSDGEVDSYHYNGWEYHIGAKS